MFSSNYHLLICSENHESHSPRRTNWCLTDIIIYTLSVTFFIFADIAFSQFHHSNKPIIYNSSKSVRTDYCSLVLILSSFWECNISNYCIINKTYRLLIVGGIYATFLRYISYINTSYITLIAWNCPTGYFEDKAY